MFNKMNNSNEHGHGTDSTGNKLIIKTNIVFSHRHIIPCPSPYMQ